MIAGMEYLARSLLNESVPKDIVLLCADAIFYLSNVATATTISSS